MSQLFQSSGSRDIAKQLPQKAILKTQKLEILSPLSEISSGEDLPKKSPF